MDQGTQEKSVTPELVKERYQKLRDAYIHDETLIDGLLWEAESQGKKKSDTFVARAVPTLHLLKIDQKRTRLVLEWVKLAFDEEEQRLENALKVINDFVKRFGPILEEFEADRERVKGRVREIGPR
jgi:hypothetical protein